MPFKYAAKLLSDNRAALHNEVSRLEQTLSYQKSSGASPKVMSSIEDMVLSHQSNIASIDRVMSLVDSQPVTASLSIVRSIVA